MKTRLLTLCALFILTLFAFRSLGQNGLSFDGSNDHVICGNSTSVQITGNKITLEAWIYPTSWKTNVWEGNIVNKEAPGAGYMLRAGASGKLNFNLGSGPWNELTSSAAVLTLNTWQHVAGTYDGSYMRIYVNGNLTDSIAKSIIISNATSNLCIGEGLFYSGRHFPGKIDEVRVWNVARTKSEIQSQMNAEFCTVPSGVKAYYTFNQGIAGGTNTSTTSLTDLSGNGNTGTLTNFALSGATSNWVLGKNISPGIVVNSISDSACNSYTTAAGTVITATGVYNDTLASSSGCDSLITYSIVISTVNDSVHRVGGKMTSIDTWASHQWVDCNNGYAPIAGATNRIYTATTAGNYAVIVGRGKCADTSDCVNISLTDIGKISPLATLSIYPNPVTDWLTIKSSRQIKPHNLSVYDISGKEMSNFKVIENKILVSHLPRGVYLIEISDQEYSKTLKFVKN